VPPPVITAIFPAKSFMASLTCELLFLEKTFAAPHPKSIAGKRSFPQGEQNAPASNIV
jgi:hypothetical protein